MRVRCIYLGGSNWQSARREHRLISSPIFSTSPKASTIGSTTPVANLTTSPATYDHAGTQRTNAHIVVDSGKLSEGTLTVFFSGAAAFSNSCSYACTVNGSTGNDFRGIYTSGSSVTFNGTGADSFRYLCVGN
jgi:hypothetical protein